MVVAAMARAACSLGCWLASRRRPRAPASSATATSTGCQPRGQQQRAGSVLFGCPPPSKYFPAGDLAGLQWCGRTLLLDKLVSSAAAQVVDQHRGVDPVSYTHPTLPTNR